MFLKTSYSHYFIINVLVKLLFYIQINEKEWKMKKELSVIEIQTLISNNVAQWLLISFRTMSFSQARIIVCILIFIICWCLFTLVDWLFKHAKNIPFYKIGPSITMGFQKCSLFLSYTMIENSRHLFTYYSTYLAVPL